MKFSLSLASVVITLLIGKSLASIDKDAFMTMEQIAAENGFATESYSLTTSDGYGLSLYRIPGTFKEMKEKKPAVLMMHC